MICLNDHCGILEWVPNTQSLLKKITNCFLKYGFREPTVITQGVFGFCSVLNDEIDQQDVREGSIDLEYQQEYR